MELYIIENDGRRKLTDEEIEIIAKEQARVRGENVSEQGGEENAG